jgi:DNA invertase Pin-like site-specific DNA recombinase
MKALYVRISSVDQKTDRQRVNEQDYDFVFEDKCSGSIPFSERNAGREVLEMVKRGVLSELHVWQIDRLGRDLRDIMNTIHFFNEIGVPIHFVSQGLSTLTADKKENPISKMIISILGVVAEMERKQIRERQLEGIKIAKLKGAFLGRKKGTNESTLDFLGKEKNRKAIDYLKKGFKINEVAKLTDLHPNTVSKIKRLGISQSKEVR